VHAARALARFLRKKGEIEGALDVCRHILERHPEDVWARRFMIRTLLEAGRTGEIGPLAIEILDRVMLDQPRYVCAQCGFQTDEPLWRCPRCAALAAFNL
jgi:lipopolysaccharide biosynthesis regulator YciM